MEAIIKQCARMLGLSDDSPTFGPEDRLPIVEGVWYGNASQKVTIEVDGRPYGPLTTMPVEATPESCEHDEAVVQLQ